MYEHTEKPCPNLKTTALWKCYKMASGEGNHDAQFGVWHLILSCSLQEKDKWQWRGGCAG